MIALQLHWYEALILGYKQDDTEFLVISSKVVKKLPNRAGLAHHTESNAWVFMQFVAAMVVFGASNQDKVSFFYLRFGPH